MIWYIASLISALLFSVSIVIDKQLMTKVFHETSSTTVTALAGIAGLPYLLLMLGLNKELPDRGTIAAGFLAGTLLLASFQLYYHALKSYDSSLVAALYLLILPINYLLGIVFFEEHITLVPLIGLVVLAASSVVISFEQKDERWHFDKKLFGTMFVSSMLWSISDVVFKKAATSTGFYDVAISEYLSSVVMGVGLVLVLPKVRKEIFKLKHRAHHILAITQLNEIVTIGASFSLRLALTLGSLALVQGIMGLQPFMVIVLGLILGWIAKTHIQRKPRLVEYVVFCFAIIGSVMISYGRD